MKRDNRISKSELARLKKLCIFEENARQRGYKNIAGIDEAGRGPLAGPVVIAACILPSDLYVKGIDDSKKLTPDERVRIFDQLISNPDICFSISVIDVNTIDQINILRATFKGMLEVVEQLKIQPDYLLVDGSMIPSFKIPSEAIIKGDGLSQSIAAASIIAKVTRDRMMLQYHEQWPQYGFDSHKGYATPQHMEAIEKHGPSSIHRMSFEPVKSNF
ncbi:MAG TPA: ribonuclease HII [Rhabdochlamydiaceae bacterium]|nr:ribonuclease HII [Rhabdochlamydiaceae bacterium]